MKNSIPIAAVDQNDIEVLRKEYLSVKDNQAALKDWLLKHNYLHTNDLCRIMQINTYRLRLMKRASGIPTGNKQFPQKKNITKPAIVVPEDWCNKEWLEKTYKSGYNQSEIGRAVGLIRQRMHKLFKKFDIKVVDRSKAYKTREWITEHYINQGIPAITCSKMMGVGAMTFMRYLTKFGIPARTLSDRSKARLTPTWAYVLENTLKNLTDIIEKVNRTNHYISVTYKSGNKEIYWYYMKRSNRSNPYAIDNQSWVYNSCIAKPLSDLGEKDSDNYIISRNDWNKSSIIEQRITINMLYNKYCEQKRITHEPTILKKDLDLVHSKSSNHKHINSDSFDIINRVTLKFPGRRIIEHVDDLTTTCSFKNFQKTFLRLLPKSASFEYYDLIFMLTRRQNNFPFSPIFYCAVLSKLGIKTEVLDVFRNHSGIAIACAMLGIKYKCLENNQRLLDIPNLDYQVWNGEVCDWTFLLGDLRHDMMDYFEAYSTKSKHIVAFVPNKDRHRTHDQYRPDLIIPIKRYKLYDPDYLFIW